MDTERGQGDKSNFFPKRRIGETLVARTKSWLNGSRGCAFVPVYLAVSG